MSLFERQLTLWVALCILGGIGLGKLAPGLAQTLDGMAIHVNGAPVVSIPIAICLFFMMYPIIWQRRSCTSATRMPRLRP